MIMMMIPLPWGWGGGWGTLKLYQLFREKGGLMTNPPGGGMGGLLWTPSSRGGAVMGSKMDPDFKFWGPGARSWAKKAENARKQP